MLGRRSYRLRSRWALMGYALRGELPVSRLRSLGFAVSGGLVPLFQGGGPEPTMTTTAAVTAGRLVLVSGDRSIAHAGAASLKVIGVAKQTADAVGDKVAIATSGVQMLRASGPIAAGDLIVAGAAGVAVANNAPPAGAKVGIALAAIVDATDGPVLLQGLS